MSKQIEKPSCYNPNDNTYPLCKGSENAIHDCDLCCLYKDFIGDEPPME